MHFFIYGQGHYSTSETLAESVFARMSAERTGIFAVFYLALHCNVALSQITAPGLTGFLLLIEYSLRQTTHAPSR